MRIAWLGPTPTDEGGVPTVATLLLKGLAEEDVDVDCFAVKEAQWDVPRRLLEPPAPCLRWRRTSWQSSHWYARDPLSAFVTDKGSRIAVQAALARDLGRRHRMAPYDLVYQFSQLELFALRALLAQLPPLVLHPEVHAAGELRWHRRERELTRSSVPASRHAAVTAMLALRARVQARDARRARMVLCPSERYARELSCDYGLEPARLRVLRNPIDLRRFHPREGSDSASGPAVLLFVSRLAARKGVEVIVELSHRLSDLEGEVEIHVIGGPSLWSDYSTLLGGMHPGIGRILGSRPNDEVAIALRDARALLQPSRFEPFALTVAEALASGTPVIAGDSVGALEGVDPRCCTVVAGASPAGFEAAVRDVLAPQRSDAGEVGRLARAEAERLFDPRVVARELVAHLQAACAAA